MLLKKILRNISTRLQMWFHIEHVSECDLSLSVLILVATQAHCKYVPLTIFLQISKMYLFMWIIAVFCCYTTMIYSVRVLIKKGWFSHSFLHNMNCVVTSKLFYHAARFSNGCFWTVLHLWGEELRYKYCETTIRQNNSNPCRRKFKYHGCINEL